MEKKLITFSDSLWAAIDVARGEVPRQRWLEHHLWRSPIIRSAAREVGVKVRPKRPKPGPKPQKKVKG